jgi:hypothetical protein
MAAGSTSEHPAAMTQDRVEIYCPQCKWRPGPLDRWSCTPNCGTVWNTFWTRAICPGCGVRWPKTQCLACQVFSPHEDWYHTRDGEDGEEGEEGPGQEEERAGEEVLSGSGR